MFFLIALAMAVAGSVPLLVARQFSNAVIATIPYFLLSLVVVYCGVPSLVWPLLGVVGVLTLVYLAISAAVAINTGDLETPGKIAVLAFPAIGFLALTVESCGGCEAINAEEYSNLIGTVEHREWTQDVQPKDPKHIRIVSTENAFSLADKQFGSVPGAIGSQFEIDKEYMTLQIVRGELWYVAPLDFRGYSVWTSTDGAPGYVMISAEDPFYPVKVVTNHKFVYTPGAFFGNELDRYLWLHGYMMKGLTDVSFEIDEDLKPWWVVTVFEPTIAFWGEKTRGVVLVDPESGALQYYPIGEIPSWVDRAVPKSFTKSYIEYVGKLKDGWLNSWWEKKNLTQPEEPRLIYGSDKQPYWATVITSTNNKDNSMVGLYYTNSRTGKTVFYHAKGSTEEAILTAVNNKVSYMKRHGDSPVLYNIYGTMAYIVPVLGENHIFQGVAICDVENLLVALGSNEVEAYRQYQKLLSSVGQQVAPELEHGMSEVVGVVDRFAAEPREGGMLYILHTPAAPDVLFSGGYELSPKLPVTKEGDKVKLGFVSSGEDVVPLTHFDNLSLSLRMTTDEAAVRARGEERRDSVRVEKEDRSARATVQNLSDEDLKQLLKLKDEKGKK